MMCKFNIHDMYYAWKDILNFFKLLDGISCDDITTCA